MYETMHYIRCCTLCFVRLLRSLLLRILIYFLAIAYNVIIRIVAYN